MFEIFYLLPFFKSVSSEKFYQNYSSTKFTNLAKLTCIKSLFEANSNFVINLFLSIGELSVLGVSTFLVYQGVLNIGDVVFYQMIFVTTFNSFSSIYKLFPSLSLVRDSISSLEELNFIKPEKKNSYDIIFTGNIELQNISFFYDKCNNSIIRDFSLNVFSGELVLIKGANGIGKTTLLKLLSGFSRAKSGKLFFDKIDVNKINLSSFRNYISIVTQEFQVFSGTIRNNITLNNNRYDISEINSVVELVELRDFINSLPNGIDEVIGNEGRKLSGGEMQKIAIARALIRKPKLLILDEVTNHLDIKSQKNIIKLIERLKGNTTIFLVSHNNNIDIKFDRIVEL